ncbi:MAG: zinc-dependent metalloprotease [Actinomycetaceae bacterium]|nr:zinc-dependent metalloprotease [Actinomycetaceae bacterium]
MESNDAPEWEKMLRSMLGDAAVEDIKQRMVEQGLDPANVQGAIPIPSNPMAMQAMMQQMNTVLGQDVGPVNWELAKETARSRVTAKSDPALTAAQSAQVRQALAAASLWLDAVTDLSPGAPDYHAWTRSQWVEGTFDTWRELSEAVAVTASTSLTKVLTEQIQELTQHGDTSMNDALKHLGGIAFGPGNPDVPDPAGEQDFQLDTLFERMAAAMFGSLLGRGLGDLAIESLGSTDIGVPLGAGSSTALVPSNVDAFMDGLAEPAGDVLAFLAVRESAYSRLYHAVPWLRPHVMSVIGDYAKEIRFNMATMEAAARDFNPMDLEQMTDSMGSGLLQPQPTEGQEVTLKRLSITLAIVEGWVEEVSSAALLPYVGNMSALGETMRRRRAVGGPAEQAFATLVGLQLRPRHIREARALFTYLNAKGGPSLRDRLWSHPDLMPTEEHLKDPESYIGIINGDSDTGDAADDELKALLEGSLGYVEGLEPGVDSEGDAEVDGKGSTEPEKDSKG